MANEQYKGAAAKEVIKFDCGIFYSKFFTLCRKPILFCWTKSMWNDGHDLFHPFSVSCKSMALHAMSLVSTVKLGKELIAGVKKHLFFLFVRAFIGSFSPDKWFDSTAELVYRSHQGGERIRLVYVERSWEIVRLKQDFWWWTAILLLLLDSSFW